MAKVLCVLPNASSMINGIEFIASEQGVVSVDITPSEAESFSGIPGFSLIDNSPLKLVIENTPETPVNDTEVDLSSPPVDDVKQEVVVEPVAILPATDAVVEPVIIEEKKPGKSKNKPAAEEVVASVLPPVVDVDVAQ